MSVTTALSSIPDKQGLISGILLMGFGISSFIFGKVFAAAAPADGGDAWRMMFKIFAVVFCVVLIKEKLREKFFLPKKSLIIAEFVGVTPP